MKDIADDLALIVRNAIDYINKLEQQINELKRKPVQEPVAWMVYTEGGTSAYVTDNPNDLVGAYRALPLYAAPPQRKPLTEQEIWDAVQHGVVGGIGLPSKAIAVARAIERAHGIGGNA